MDSTPLSLTPRAIAFKNSLSKSGTSGDQHGTGLVVVEHQWRFTPSNPTVSGISCQVRTRSMLRFRCEGARDTSPASETICTLGCLDVPWVLLPGTRRPPLLRRSGPCWSQPLSDISLGFDTDAYRRNAEASDICPSLQLPGSSQPNRTVEIWIS